LANFFICRFKNSFTNEFYFTIFIFSFSNFDLDFILFFRLGIINHHVREIDERFLLYLTTLDSELWVWSNMLSYFISTSNFHTPIFHFKHATTMPFTASRDYYNFITFTDF